MLTYVLILYRFLSQYAVIPIVYLIFKYYAYGNSRSLWPWAALALGSQDYFIHTIRILCLIE